MSDGLGLVVTITSAKGGVCKTTLTLNIGIELAGRGYRVMVLDADTNAHCAIFGAKADVDNLDVLGKIDEENVLSEVKSAKADGYDFILIDAPGGTSHLSLKMMPFSHYILIPTPPASMDARDAVRTHKHIREQEEGYQRKIPHGIIWTKVDTGRKASKEQRAVQKSVEVLDAEIFRSSLVYRNVYDAVMVYNRPLAQLAEDPQFTKEKRPQFALASKNIEVITDELIEKLSEGGAISLGAAA